MFELRLMCPEDRVERLSDALEALDALSVSVEDADAQTDAEQALFGEPGLPPPKDGWQRSRVLALFAEREAAQTALQLLQLQDFFVGCSVPSLQAPGGVQDLGFHLNGCTPPPFPRRINPGRSRSTHRESNAGNPPPRLHGDVELLSLIHISEPTRPY